MSKFKNQGEWASLRKYVPEICVELELNSDECSVHPGFVYPDGAWIELMVDKAIWHTIAGCDEFTNYNIEEVEDFLWEFHSQDNAEDEENALVIELKKYCEDNGLKPACAGELVCELMAIRSIRWDQATSLTTHIDWLMDYSKRWYAVVNKEGK